MRVIYKYTVPFMEVAYVELPEDSTILRVDGIDGQIYLWAVVDTEKPLIRRKFYLFKTGMKMPDNIDSYLYHGCGAIFIGMELMMYVYSLPGDKYEPVVPLTRWEGFPV